MAGGEDGPDTSSIKPISSLKSRFENLSQAQVVDRPPQSATKSLSSSRDRHFLRSDESSIIRRGEELAFQSSDPTSRNDVHVNLNESRGRSNLTRSRPQSMVSLTPSQHSPLAVTLNASKSPSKNLSLDMRATNGSFSSTVSRSANVSPTRSQSRMPSTMADRPVRGRPTPTSYPSSPTPTMIRGGDPIKQLSLDSESSSPSRALPPPVNRAAKPKINPKPNVPSEKPETLAVPHHDLGRSERSISPFGTPPGSVASSPDPQNKAQAQGTKDDLNGSNLGYHPYDTNPPSFISARGDTNKSDPFNRVRTDSDASFVEPSSLPEQTPPMLPTRASIARNGQVSSNSNSVQSHDARQSMPVRSIQMIAVSASPQDRPSLPTRPDVQRQIEGSNSSDNRKGSFAPEPVSRSASSKSLLATEDTPLTDEFVNTRDAPAPKLPPRSALTQGFAQNPTRSNVTVPPHGQYSRPNENAEQSRNIPNAKPPSVAPTVPPPRRTVDRRRLEGQSVPTTPVESSEAVLNSRGNEERAQLDGPAASLSTESTIPLPDIPEYAISNRRPPHYRSKNKPAFIPTDYETRLAASSGDYVCTTGYITRVWNLRTGDPILSLPHIENIKMTSMIVKPSLASEGEGTCLWLGTSVGEIHELDILERRIVKSRTNAHSHREVSRMFRYAMEIWTLDESGDLNVWKPDRKGLPSLDSQCVSFRLPRRHSFAIACGRYLWVATGKEIRVFLPGARSDAEFQALREPLAPSGVGDITTGTLLASKPDLVYFGHSDGKVTIYQKWDYICVGTISISTSKISSLLGVGDCIWAGFNSGMVYVYDPNHSQWRVRKEWQAHDKQICCMATDVTTSWTMNRLQVVTLGADNMLRMWDGTLEDDWLSSRMDERDAEYCSFRQMSAAICTWNAGASKPQHLQHSIEDSGFFQDFLTSFHDPPDLFVFGFQELVDLEDKKLTAKAFFRSKKKDGSEQEYMSHQYRAWRDHLVANLEHYMASEQRYNLLQVGNLVGLFTCIFVKATEHHRIKHVHMGQVKRGMGGLHGNKGALIVRMVIDDSSICFINCHLAAGQTQTLNRNNDIAVILDTEALPAYPLKNDGVSQHDDVFVAGGDGSRILDHEICLLNGDLNYRIDTMGRDVIIKHIASNNLNRLLERDQLLLSKKKNPGFRLRVFQENPITFAPTYKYNVHSDDYDTSEKRRAPAWCDRILYHGRGKVKLEDYRRWEVRVSDHRPVTGRASFRVKTVDPVKRSTVWQKCQQEFDARMTSLAKAEQ